MDTVVKPKTVRLSLSDGQYIDVKRRLNTGEQQDLFAVMAPTLTPGERAQLQTHTVMTAKVMAYLLGWSFMDDGVPIPMSPDLPDSTRLATLRSLDPDVFSEIREAIDAHEAAIDKEMAERKNARTAKSDTSNASLSPDGLVTAVQTGSVN